MGSKRSCLALWLLAMLAGCALPTSEAPRVKSSSGESATIEYSGEKGEAADRKAQEACARQGKRAANPSAKPGPTGGTLRSYECVE